MVCISARRSLCMGVLAAATLASVGSAWAEDSSAYPNPARQIRIIVPFTAGGSSDVQARMLADRLGRMWNQPVVVENKPGAGGHLGGKYVSDQPADGYTLMVGSIGLHAAYGVYKKLPYDPAKELRVVTVLAEMPHVVVATPNLPVKNLQDLTALAKKDPGSINFGSAGVGSSVHMMGELYKLQSGAPIVHVPYRGSSAALNDLLGGQIQLMFENPPTVLAHVKGGKLKALAVTSAKRSTALPDVPTVEEAGGPALKGFEASSWFGLLAPAGTPADIVQRVQQEVAKALATPAVKERLLSQGAIPGGNTSAEFASLIDREHRKWAQVVKASGAKVD